MTAHRWTTRQAATVVACLFVLLVSPAALTGLLEVLA